MIEDVEEDEEEIEDDDLKPRERSLPSYIKKPKPIISSESEDEDEDDIEEEEEEEVDVKDQQETFEALSLIDEDDEVVRPPSKRKQPKIRKRSSGSDEESESYVCEICGQS